MSRTRLLVLVSAPIVGLAAVLVVLLLRHEAPRGSEARPAIEQAAAIESPVPAPPEPERVAQAAPGEDDSALAPLVAPAEEADPTETTEEIGFLPYPNNGEEDFAKKYGSLSAAEIYGRLYYLNATMSGIAEKETLARIDSGRYFAREPIQADQLRGDEGEDFWWPDKPVGQGQVWPCSTVVGLDTDTPELRYTYLTEQEYPELFAKRDEYLFAAHLWWEKDKAWKEKAKDP